MLSHFRLEYPVILLIKMSFFDFLLNSIKILSNIHGFCNDLYFFLYKIIYECNCVLSTFRRFKIIIFLGFLYK